MGGIRDIMKELILFVIIKILMISTTLCHHVNQGEVVYISPSPSYLDNSNLCLSLDELATNTSWFKSNTALSMIFLPGIHTLSIKFSIFNFIYLSLLSESFLEQSSSVVICQKNTGFDFYGITNVSVSGLKLLGCKCDVVSVKQLLIENSTFQGKKDSGTALKITATNAKIFKSVFIFNRIGWCVVSNDQLHTLVGGAIFAVKNSNITIVESRFESNGAIIGGAMFVFDCKLKIVNSTFINNQATVANISTISINYCSDSGIATLYNAHGSFQLQRLVQQSYNISSDLVRFGSAQDY